MKASHTIVDHFCFDVKILRFYITKGGRVHKLYLLSLLLMVPIFCLLFVFLLVCLFVCLLVCLFVSIVFLCSYVWWSMEAAKGLWVTYDKGKNYSLKNEKQLKETCMWVFLYLTYHIVSWWFTVLLLGEIRCQLVRFKVPLVAAISPYLILPTDPIHAWKVWWNQR